MRPIQRACPCDRCQGRRTAPEAVGYTDPLLGMHLLVDQMDRAVIGPVDNRVQEVDTRRFPMSTVVHLCREFGDDPCSGCSGALIGPDLVLTAAHCLWSPRHKGPPLRISVAPGRTDRDTLPFGTVRAARWWLPRAFVQGKKPALWDFGVIKLVRPVVHTRRFMPLSAPSDAELAEIAARSRLTIAGYPSDRPIGTLWRHTERLRKVTPQRLFYSVDTCPGHSGSAIFVDRGRGPEIIGVHTTGVLDAEGRSYGCARGSVLAPANLFNSGVRLTRSVLDAIRKPGASAPAGVEMLVFDARKPVTH